MPVENTPLLTSSEDELDCTEYERGVDHSCGRPINDDSINNNRIEDSGSYLSDHSGTNIKSYKRRWYILFVFSSIAFVQSVVWNTWGPIAQTAELVFPTWNDTDIALLSNWGNITYVVFLVPLCWLMDVKGLRVALITVSAMILAGTALRCVTTEVILATWLIHSGQILNGMAGIVTCSAPALVSANWFPIKQRTTATSVATVINTMGVAVASVMGPAFVPVPIPHSHEKNTSQWDISRNMPHESFNPADINRARDNLMLLLYAECAVSAVVFMCVSLYFPSKPKRPPSISASITRIRFKQGVNSMLRNVNLWLICIAYGVATGVNGAWLSVINLNLKAIQISQVEAGWIAFYAIIGICLGSLILARLVDHFGSRMKWVIITALLLSSLCFMWFAAICLNYIPFSRMGVYISVILGATLNSSTTPLFYELAAEVAYPVNEGVIGGLLTGLYNVVGTAFLMVFFIPNIGALWMNWCLIGSNILAVPFLAFVKENYCRASMDKLPFLANSIQDTPPSDDDRERKTQRR